MSPGFSPKRSAKTSWRLARGSATGRTVRCRAVRLSIAWASPARQRGCAAGRPASATAEAQVNGRGWRQHTFWRPGPHPARRDAIRTQPAARPLAPRSARARQDDHADAADEATCRAWAARQGFQLDVLDRDLPAFSDACRWIWARMSRGLISDDDLTAKLARLRNRITEAGRAFDHSR